jgi:hypothetical protein
MRSISAYSLADWGRYRHIEGRPVRATLGAEVRCGDLKHASDEAFLEMRKAWLDHQMRKAWLDHLVLVFRGQSQTDDDLLVLGAL